MNQPEEMLQVKINKMMLALITIKRLMPEVEAELSRLSGVGAARGIKKIPEERELKILKQFNKTVKVKQ